MRFLDDETNEFFTKRNCPQIPKSPNPQISKSPNPHITKSTHPQISKPPNPQIPKSPKSQIPQYTDDPKKSTLNIGTTISFTL